MKFGVSSLLFFSGKIPYLIIYSFTLAERFWIQMEITTFKFYTYQSNNKRGYKNEQIRDKNAESYRTYYFGVFCNLQINTESDSYYIFGQTRIIAFAYI